MPFVSSSINKHIDRIIIRLKTIPESPGVYQHLDEQGNVIYVGKATNLHRRVSSYFTRYEDHSSKIKMLVRNICDIRVTVVDNEVEALLLENSLIKRYQPRYNSLLKDDKSYPNLCITNEEYPRLLFTRDRSRNQGQYFGPYPNQRILRELQEIIEKLFRYRRCNGDLHRQTRPCINHAMGKCPAPCAGEISQNEYQETFRQIRKILKGEFGPILEEMKKQMFTLADELRFEEADLMKRKIRLLEEYQSRSTVVDTNVHDVDVFGIVSDSSYAYVHMMRIKEGRIICSFPIEIRKQLDEDDAEILSSVIPQLHERTESSAREIVIPIAVPEIPEDYLHQTVPSRGDRLKLVELANRNARSYQQQCTQQRLLTNPDDGRQQLLERIQKALTLPRLPKNIECFDNSNIQGAYPVAGMVRFTDGKPNKAEYRKFNIKTVEGPDDYASMAEVIYRRYKRLSEEQKPLPDLLIVDGGRGQMEVAREVIEDQLHLDIPIAGLAKDDRHHTSELLFGNPPMVVGMKPSDPLFHLLEQIQNEVHRFAITFHKEKRRKGTLRTQLTELPGIGEKTAQELLLKFGSVKAIKGKSEQELAAAIGPAKAKIVFEGLR